MTCAWSCNACATAVTSSTHPPRQSSSIAWPFRIDDAVDPRKVRSVSELALAQASALSVMSLCKCCVNEGSFVLSFH